MESESNRGKKKQKVPEAEGSSRRNREIRSCDLRTCPSRCAGAKKKSPYKKRFYLRFGKENRREIFPIGTAGLASVTDDKEKKNFHVMNMA